MRVVLIRCPQLSSPDKFTHFDFDFRKTFVWNKSPIYLKCHLSQVYCVTHTI